MNKKLKDLLTRNIGLKILALVFSLFLWFFVVSVNDPEQTQTFTAAVQVTNADVLEQTGEYYQVADGKTTVTFQATAKRSILDKLTSADFTATADMNFLDREKGRIPVEISVNRYVTQVNLSTRARYLNVVIGEKTSSKFVIEGEVKGAPADGFAVSSVAVSPNIITVDGPSTKVKQISRVVATVDVDGMSKDVTEAVVPTFLDENGDAIDTSDLTINLSSVQVTAEINSVKAVAIKVDTTGELGEGLELDKISTDPSTVTIVGSSSILNDITDITIPSTVVDLSTITEDFETTVDITRYLPDGVSLLNSKEGTVKIQVDVISHQEKVFVVPTANITLTNVADKARCPFGHGDHGLGGLQRSLGRGPQGQCPAEPGRGTDCLYGDGGSGYQDGYCFSEHRREWEYDGNRHPEWRLLFLRRQWKRQFRNGNRFRDRQRFLFGKDGQPDSESLNIFLEDDFSAGGAFFSELLRLSSPW